MNEGRYPLDVVNEAIDRVREGVDPKDVADEIRLKYGYEKLHAKSVARWHRKWPMGKLPKSLPAAFREDVRQLIREETSMTQVSVETIAVAKLAAGAAESGIYGKSQYGGASYA